MVRNTRDEQKKVLKKQIKESLQTYFKKTKNEKIISELEIIENSKEPDAFKRSLLTAKVVE